jgi:hypothetical protein
LSFEQAREDPDPSFIGNRGERRLTVRRFDVETRILAEEACYHLFAFPRFE